MSSTLAVELAEAAADSPDRVFVRTRSAELTYRECAQRVERAVRQLRALGVSPGDTVALLMGNSCEQVVLWFALNRLGALHAPVNTALDGALLAHALRTAEAKLVVADEGLVGRVTDVVETHRLDARVLLHADVAAAEPPPSSGTAADRERARVDPLSVATLLFTSGTTGPSKACALSHRYLVRQGQLHAAYLGLTAADVLYCPFPLFHIDAATLTVSAALSVRATAALGERFSASGFWEEVRAFEATVFNFMGATLAILWKQPPTAGDRDHRVRLAWGVPIPDWQAGFEQRFGFPLRQLYGLTDAGIPAYDPLVSGQRPGTAGRVIEEYDVRIDTDRRRPGDPPGAGEILVRGREPGLTMNGYHGDPDATARTIVDGWVRTGDLGELDDDGFLTFHGRLSDSIRRRGENMSATEVEDLVCSHALVLEAAAVGVPSELTEEEVLVWVVLREGAELTAPALREHCLARGPRHMVPRYLRIVPALPKTPTQKVEKFRIRDVGVAEGTWDAEG